MGNTSSIYPTLEACKFYGEECEKRDCSSKICLQEYNYYFNNNTSEWEVYRGYNEMGRVIY